MNATDQPDRRLRAIAAALSLNRGEIDPVKLERVLQLLASATPEATAA